MTPVWLALVVGIFSGIGSALVAAVISTGDSKRKAAAEANRHLIAARDLLEEHKGSVPMFGVSAVAQAAAGQAITNRSYGSDSVRPRRSPHSVREGIGLEYWRASTAFALLPV